jgi:hypothetical protein
MNMTTKKDIFARYLREYLKTSKERQGKILDHVCDVIKMHRKSAVRKFRVLQLKDNSQSEGRGRKAYYTPDSVAALKTVWEASSEVCGELVHPIIADYVKIFQRDKQWTHTDEATEKLLKMSEATVKRKVGNFLKARKRRKGLSATKPSNLKEIIPIFTGPWTDKPPGYGQIDTVVHCGASLLGDMAYSCNYTDVSVLWVSFAAQWNKGEKATKVSLEKIKKKVPFPILGMHPDTGSEFINWTLKKWTEEKKIDYTRSRPGHKNDNAYVEQKNGHVIRRFLGYTRFDCPEIIDLMNKLYDKLEIYLNHFVPSRKCLEKVRIGSRYKRKYDKAKTAYQRILDHSDVNLAIKDKLKREHETLNPLLLKNNVGKLIADIYKLQKDYRDAKIENESGR